LVQGRVDWYHQTFACWHAPEGLLSNINPGTEIEAGIQSGVLLDVDPDLIAYNLALLAHGWALKHWFLGPRQTLQQYIAFELGLILRSIIRPERMSDYCHLIGGGQ